ncbi:MAG: hypothetical protein M3P98_03145 [bacterium]|nr:hypothetical protein [bacterium]
MGWNGLDLINDLSAELGDTSNSFKTKVLRWINEGVKEIATSHNWEFLREKAKIVLESGTDTHPIVMDMPGAPTVAALAGGSLALLTEYKVLVTFYEAQSKVESIAGTASAGITPLGADLGITLSSIPISTSPLVTARKVYISTTGGAFQYHGIINNNLTETGAVGFEVPVTYVITAPTTSVLTPPEENAIFMIDGEFYIEDSRIICGTSLQDLIFKSNASNTNGIPELWASINQEEIQVYPSPTTDTTASFFYFKIPSKIFGIATSVPEIPSWLYNDLRNYVIWRGYNYRDRAGQESKKLNYDEGLRLTISRKGKSTKKSGRVRSVTPDSDGLVY